MPTFWYITCDCGHTAYIATSRWLHRDEMLRRLRCKACGGRPESLIMVVNSNSASVARMSPDILNDLTVIGV